MKLPVPFVQLPLMFDAAALAREIAAFDESDWIPHPDAIPGNSALPLATVNGDPTLGDALQGPMRPTPNLARSPYLRQVMGSLEAVLGRIRLMRLSGGSEVEPHVDTNHYWNERVRVHVPIVTQPSVRFLCDDAEVNMAAGECWIFDTWRMHRVVNEDERARIHLVIDTVGSPRFWNLVNAGRPHLAPKDGWQPTLIAPRADAMDELRFETVNLTSPMTYWEVRGHVQFLLSEAVRHPAMPAIVELSSAFAREWQALWYQHGGNEAGFAEYRRVLDVYLGEIGRLGRDVPLQNGASFAAAAIGLFSRAVKRPSAAPVSEEGSRTRGAPAVHLRSDEAFDRPVFIVSPPRSGSSLLFETLARSPDAFTTGGESHGLIEGIDGLGVDHARHDSNRLTASDATPEVAAMLRARFHSSVFDRLRRPPQARFRLMEKTPKNSLRIPLLAEIFPDAHFVYLYRDPRQSLASMLEAWESGGFRTYAKLPDWSGLPWSLLLVPGWRELIGKPLPDIVGAQWETTTRILLDDLDAIPAARRTVARYDALVADPSAEIERLCAALDLRWDQPLGTSLPLADHTVSAPAADKWRRREAQILPVLERIEATAARAERFAAR